MEQLKELQQELKAYGVKAFNSTGTKEEELAEMTERLTLAVEEPEPEPAPEAKKLIETLLQRCFIWTAIIKAK